MILGGGGPHCLVSALLCANIPSIFSTFSCSLDYYSFCFVVVVVI